MQRINDKDALTLKVLIVTQTTPTPQQPPALGDLRANSPRIEGFSGQHSTSDTVQTPSKTFHPLYPCWKANTSTVSVAFAFTTGRTELIHQMLYFIQF